MAKVYDCFLFYDELRILRLRLEELDLAVDYFVLVESPYSFTGLPKPLYFEQHKGEFGKFAGKIRHVVVGRPPEPKATAWDAETHQRNAIGRGIQDAAPEDVIVVSDVDEIPRAGRIQEFATGSADVVALETRLYYYKLNCKCLTGAAHAATSILLRRRRFTVAQEARLWARHFWKFDTPIVSDSGWHFACMQDAPGLSRKLQSFSHTEFSGPEFTDVRRIEWRIRYGLDIVNRRDMVFSAVPLDDTFPAYLREHQAEYIDMLFDVATFHADRQQAICELTEEVDKLQAENRQLAAQVQALTNSPSYGA